MLVTVAAFAEETRTDTRTAPQLGIQPPASPVPPTVPTVPTVPTTAVAQPPVAQPLAAEAPDPNHKPSFIDVFGRFLGDSATKLNSHLKSTNETLGHLGSQTSDAAKDAALGAVGTAKDAAGTLMGLPSARIVTGRERCVIAPNGVPDCRAAADAACRGKGFGSGRSLDTQSAQKCPARVWLSGRLPAEGDCPLETFVTRSVCQ
jgi:hypothetical protein